MLAVVSGRVLQKNIRDLKAYGREGQDLEVVLFQPDDSRGNTVRVKFNDLKLFSSINEEENVALLCAIIPWGRDGRFGMSVRAERLVTTESVLGKK